MKRAPVTSSMISSVGYDESTKVLEVEFDSGAVWEYRGVPKKVYDELLASRSKGSYMKDFVIDCYPDTRIRRANGHGP